MPEYTHHEHCATKRTHERNRRQHIMVMVSRLAALEEAALNAELQAGPPGAPALTRAPGGPACT